MLTYLRINPNNATLLDNVADDVFDKPIDEERRKACASSPDRVQLVSIRDGLVIGQLLAVVHRHMDKPSELYIDDLGVAGSARRQGIARRLMSKARGIGRGLGLSGIWVVTEPENVDALQLYRAMGMKSRPAIVFEEEPIGL